MIFLSLLIIVEHTKLEPTKPGIAVEHTKPSIVVGHTQQVVERHIEAAIVVAKHTRLVVEVMDLEHTK